ncbi:hypothetical protein CHINAEXTREME_17180 [Halobiforma lacisalsi AJ5]|uniref:Uncharacterized protein n=1 Tax=Natronobacterium lacisalsi AJ5 TaxID=358396 RepID=M0LQB9_NATLA|nr:hypothetical protein CHINAEXTREME_17180 [Halobiforma lacisalsi AJ5]EMA35303.1 hypothetical protein C445_05603 [Halobiforma lacisalsi AJ5]
MLPIDGAAERLTTEQVGEGDVERLLEDGLDRREWLVVKRTSTFVGEFAIIAHVDGEWWTTMATAHPILGVDRSPPRRVEPADVREWTASDRVYRCHL